MRESNENKKISERGALINEIRVKLPSYSVNESAARAIVGAFCAQLDPAASELTDIKCAVSEAVTNCIVHAYKDTLGIIYITVKLYEKRLVSIEIKDKGRGIEDVRLARQPLYTTDAENERSGMGFTVMESFCDKVRVNSGCKKGTTVILYKLLKSRI
jgi:stage II sporulation protein AB (anti-sigma F factor)